MKVGVCVDNYRYFKMFLSMMRGIFAGFNLENVRPIIEPNDLRGARFDFIVTTDPFTQRNRKWHEIIDQLPYRLEKNGRIVTASEFEKIAEGFKHDQEIKESNVAALEILKKMRKDKSRYYEKRNSILGC